MNNRLHNINNPFQGANKKVLCVCSAGLLRSPTAANVLHIEYGFNTRSAGIHSDYALIPVDEVLLRWADEVVCMEEWQHNEVVELFRAYGIAGKSVALNIPDEFEFMEEELQRLIVERYAS